ncbi:MAG: amino-acid acetyltransferase, partial [Chloroflexota bacterium]
MSKGQTQSAGATTETALISIRPARLEDAEGILTLVNHHARRGELLPRSLQSITTTIDDWLVAGDGERILACVSLLRYTSGLVEVRSLAVSEGLQG